MISDPKSIELLSQFVTPERLQRMNSVLAQRNRYLTVVLEDIYQSHNASAVLRSCDAFGVQDVHIIEKRNEYRINPEIALGSAQWLSLHKHVREAADTRRVLSDLKQQGYRIVATSPHPQGHMLHELPLATGPMALVFGTELTGLSDDAMALADEFVAIPMYGFVESFNISVSVAICLSYLCQAIRTTGLSWQLKPAETEALLSDWLKTSVKHSSAILERITTEGINPPSHPSTDTGSALSLAPDKEAIS